jgi:hypothetical protein
MVLQRIATVTCTGARLDTLDLYELRLRAGGPATLYEAGTAAAVVGVLYGFHERVIYEAAGRQLRYPMVSTFEDGKGSLVLRVSALRSSQGGERPMDLIEL